MKLIENINKPSDLKALNYISLKKLAKEIREYLISVTSTTGGHLSSNLGVVELTLALCRNFDLPNDKVVFDVGHQSYVYKMLTGRYKELKNIRQFGGISGFPKINESKYDCFGTGHSSTSISAGIGIFRSNEILNREGHVVSIIGDGSMTGGMAYEAMNNIADMKKNFIVVLNDNQMSIDKNVGSLAKHLRTIRTIPMYKSAKHDIENTLLKVPAIGPRMVDSIREVKNSIKHLFVEGMFFEEWGFTYLGPIDGHNIRELDIAFAQAKLVEGPVLLHIKTKKGKGYEPAEKNPGKFHGVKPFDIKSGKALAINNTLKSYSQVVGDTLVDMATIRKDIVAITAAMKSGTGLVDFSKRFPKRFFDVGIAEQHAVTMCAGLAAGSLKPFFVVYSSFLQRGYDQLIHDVAIQKLPVTFCLDRSGIVGEDGETHQGVFDISYLSSIPNFVIMAPRSDKELKEMMYFSSSYNGPVAIRYPKGIAVTQKEKFKEIALGEFEYIVENKENKVVIISVGEYYNVCKNVVNKFGDIDLINIRFIAPMNEEEIEKLIEKYTNIFVCEQNVINGGVTSIISTKIMKECSLNSKVPPLVYGFGIENEFVEHGKKDILLKHLKLDENSIFEKIKKLRNI